jgi:hypothetical protein
MFVPIKYNRSHENNITNVFIFTIPRHYSLIVNHLDENLKYDEKLICNNDIVFDLCLPTKIYNIDDVITLITDREHDELLRIANTNNQSNLDKLQTYIQDQKESITQLTGEGNKQIRDEINQYLLDAEKYLQYEDGPNKWAELNKGNKDIKNKYLKYKQKYLQLKNLLKKQKML